MSDEKDKYQQSQRFEQLLGKFNAAYERGELGYQPLTPMQVRDDAARQFDASRKDRNEFYAAWSAYDAALELMPEPQRRLQQRAEVLDLERQFNLSI